MTKRVTAADVGVAAGVSKWTVNRAFAPNSPIADVSRKRVLEVAERLGYTPNLLARSLSTKSTHVIAVLVDDFTNPYKLPFLDRMTAELQRQGMVAMLVNIHEHYSHVNAVLQAAQRQVDAAVLMGTAFHEETLRDSRLEKTSLPLFVLARESTIEWIPSVTCDPEVSISAMCDHFAARGYRQPGFMTGPKTLSTALGRQKAFTDGCRRHGMKKVVELEAGTYEREAGSRALRGYLDKTAAKNRIDILLCENDVLAFGAMDTARSEFGLRVPEDLAIAGYDGSDFAAAPAYDLTTYEQPVDDMVSLMIDMVLGRVKPAFARLEGKLLVRKSA